MSALPRVLIADDSEASRALLTEYLEGEGCEILTTADGPSTVAAAEAQPPDLILLDFDMPGLNGLEVCRQLRKDRRHQLLPIVMVSGFSELADRVAALEAGVDDFLRKPIERSELIARVRSLLHLKSIHDRLEDTRRVVYALAKAAEVKDTFTLAHAERVADLACEVAGRLGVSDTEIDQIRAGALIHDIGKLAVPDEILNKAGSLTPEEFDAVKRHCVVGAEIVGPLSSQPTLVAIVRSHHEQYDGRGYPDGLAGESIPLAARIVAICDAYDAMVNNRPYRPALSAIRASATLFAGRNQQWDGKLVDVFLSVVADSEWTSMHGYDASINR